MKKLILLQVALLLGVACYAQLPTGLKQIGGSVSFSQSSSKLNTGELVGETRELSVLPRFGYFVNEELSVGITTGIANRYQSQPNNGNLDDLSEIESTSYIVGAYLRWHEPISDRFYFFLQPETVVSFGKSSFSEVTNEPSSNGFAVGLRPGFLFMPNEHWGIESNFGYFGYSQNNSKADQDADPNVSKSFGFDLGGTTLQVGVQFYF